MSELIENIIKNAIEEAKPLFDAVEAKALKNQEKVLSAFRNNKVAYRHFSPTTGYGYGDIGRETLSNIFAEVFGAEAAIFSPNLLSGTHTLTVALFGLLKTGEHMLCATGAPYDTLQEVIHGEGNGSLKDYGVTCDTINLKADGTIDYNAIGKYLEKTKTNVVFATRSRGYSWRNAISVQEIGKLAHFVKEKSPNTLVFVDNCYGEFVDIIEPCAVGADAMAGSLIKNPGGGIAPTGGYIAGTRTAIDRIANRLTSPSIGTEVGSYAASYRPFYEGLFFAPSVVANAIKGSILLAHAMKKLGYKVSPAENEIPNDIIRAVEFNTAEELISFIQSIQYVSPVDSNVVPEPWEMPGYEDKVIMAAGTFVEGASIELSADSPIRAPYVAYVQGGLTFEHCVIAIREALGRLVK